MLGVSAAAAAASIRRRICSHVLTGACRRVTRPLASQSATIESPTPQIPLLVMPSYQNSYLYDPTLDEITSTKLAVPPISRCVGSSQGFLLSVNDEADLIAVNPLTGARLPLPLTASLPNFIGVVSLPYYINGVVGSPLVSEYVRILDNDEEEDDDHHDNSSSSMITISSRSRRRQMQKLGTLAVSYMRSRFFRKALLSPSLDLAVVITTTISGRTKYPELVFARPGVDESWAALSSPIGALSDVIFSKRDSRLIYAVNGRGALAALRVDRGSSSSSSSSCIIVEGPSLGTEDPGALNETMVFLVESPDGGSLFLLRGVGGTDTGSFEVFKLDTSSLDHHGCKWEAVESIGDLAFFVGKIDSLSLCLPASAPAPAGYNNNGSTILRPNCIYFDSGCGIDRLAGAGVFSLETGIMKPSRKYELSHWQHHIWLTLAAASHAPS